MSSDQDKENSYGCTALFGIVFSILFAAWIAIKPPAPPISEEAKWTEQKQRIQNNADWVAKDIHYFKDPRTNVCFAYYWNSGSAGGLSVATVSCEAIPPEFLVVAELPGFSKPQ